MGPRCQASTGPVSSMTRISVKNRASLFCPGSSGPTQSGSGASWNRTSDLSIISGIGRIPLSPDVSRRVPSSLVVGLVKSSSGTRRDVTGRAGTQLLGQSWDSLRFRRGLSGRMPEPRDPMRAELFKGETHDPWRSLDSCGLQPHLRLRRLIPEPLRTCRVGDRFLSFVPYGLWDIGRR